MTSENVPPHGSLYEAFLSRVTDTDPTDQLSILKLTKWFKENGPVFPAPPPTFMDDALKLLFQLTANNLSPQKTLDALAALVTGVSKKGALPPPSPVPVPVVEERLPTDVDPSLFGDFVPEAGEHLEAGEAALLALEKTADDPDAINTVFRAFHTLKGMAGYVHLRLTSDLAHQAESLLSRVRDKEIAYGPVIANLSLRSVDILKELVASVRTAVQTGGALSCPSGYAALLQELKQAATGAVSASPVVAPSKPLPSSSETTQAPEPASAVAPVASPPVPTPAPVNKTSRPATESSVETTVRIRTDRLDRLINAVGELVIAQSMITQDPAVLSDSHGALSHKVSHLDRVVRDLRDLAMALRLVPMKGPFQKAARAVRDVAQKSGKNVDLRLSGEDAEVDRNVVETMDALLLHLVRNAVDHGMETPAEREKTGKDPAGVLNLSATHEGGSLVVDIEDDGKGLDREKIKQRARERGLVPADRELTDEETLRLIFLPGFSTAEKVTDVSGRGVGLDVVRKGIENLRGQLDLSSEPGKGTRFRIRLPLTLAVTDGMLVRVDGQTFILPTISIRQTVRPDLSTLSTVAGRGELLNLRGELIPVYRLRRVLGLSEDESNGGLLVIVEDHHDLAALWVDDLLGQQQVVTKSLGVWFGHVSGVSGGAILGDGRVGLILNPAEIVRLARQGGAPLAPTESLVTA